MPFKPGHKKIGGRKTGSLNKATLLSVEEICIAKGFSPVEVLIEIAIDPKNSYRAKAAAELLPYLYSRPTPGMHIDLAVHRKAEEIEAMSKEDQIKLLESELKRLKGS